MRFILLYIVLTALPCLAQDYSDLYAIYAAEHPEKVAATKQVFDEALQITKSDPRTRYNKELIEHLDDQATRLDIEINELQRQQKRMETERQIDNQLEWTERETERINMELELDKLKRQAKWDRILND